jgi:SP family sugar:H+ symporter-like MFS transporter
LNQEADTDIEFESDKWVRHDMGPYGVGDSHRALSIAIPREGHGIGLFTPFITGDIDFAYGYVFAGCLFAGVVIVYFCVLEGKGKTLEEMDMMYVMRVPAWKSSKWVPPPPEHQITTAQALDRRTAVEIDRAESSGRQDADSDWGHHQHIDDSGAGPSSA